MSTPDSTAPRPGGRPRRTCALIALLASATPIAAQRADSAAVVDTAVGAPRTRALGVRGTVGSALEGYTSDGGFAARPGTSARVFADLDFSLFGLSSGLNLLLTTEEAGHRQSVNRVGYAGAWRWGELQAGDVSLSYSPYSVQGTSLRGGAIELRPGPFLVSFAHGQSRRSARLLPGAFSTPAYQRTLTAVRLGAGRAGGTHLHLIGVSARDAGTTDSTRRTATRENLSVSPDLGLSLFRGALRVLATGTVSAVTRERSSSEIAGIEGAELLTDAFTPRVGSRVDYAGQASAEWRAAGAGVLASYERVNPGFESLGVGYLRSDRETLRLRPRAQLAGVQLDGTFSTTRDNLRGDQLATQRRSEAGMNAQTRLGRVTLAAGYLLFQNRSTPGADSAAVLAPEREQRMHALTLTPALALPGSRATQVVTATVSLQRLTDQGPAGEVAPLAGFENLSTNLTYVLALPSGLSLNAGGMWLRSDAGVVLTELRGVSAGGGLNGRAFSLTGSLGVTATRAELAALDQRSRQLRADLDASYRMDRGGTLRLGLHLLDNAARSESGRSFRELRSELRYERTFASR